jgi:hypothetical protein
MKIDNQNGRAKHVQETEQQNYITYKNKIFIGILIICGIISFILFHERKELLIALYIILYLISPLLIYLISLWVEAEEEKKTTFKRIN